MSVGCFARVAAGCATRAVLGPLVASQGLCRAGCARVTAGRPLARSRHGLRWTCWLWGRAACTVVGRPRRVRCFNGWPLHRGFFMTTVCSRMLMAGPLAAPGHMKLPSVSSRRLHGWPLAASGDVALPLVCSTIGQGCWKWFSRLPNWYFVFCWVCV